MKITRVWLDESQQDCTMCGLCKTNCPDVFDVPEKMIVKGDADLAQVKNIEKAAAECPVNVIAIEYNNSGRRDNNFHGKHTTATH